MISNVDTNVFFSNSSVNIVSSFYNLDKKTILLKPHSMDYFKSKAIDKFDTSMIRVGIVGEISLEIKGSEFLKSFLYCAEENELCVSIFGEYIYKIIDSKYCKVIGRYTTDNLREKLIAEKINMILFTSICPETFSYVISELMILDLPIVCFNVGAQAEKVSRYNKGKVIEYSSPLPTIAAIKELYEEVYNRES